MNTPENNPPQWAIEAAKEIHATPYDIPTIAKGDNGESVTAAIIARHHANSGGRKLAGFSGYTLEDDGTVRTLNGSIIKPSVHPKHGHHYVRLRRDDNVSIKTSVHRLIARAFHGEPPTASSLACHRNDIPADNRPENLYWGTRASNASDAIRNGRTRFGEFNPACKLSDADVFRIRELRAGGWTHDRIAAELSCSQSHVTDILNNKKRMQHE